MPATRSRLGLSVGWWLARNALIPATVGAAVFKHKETTRKRREKAEREMRKKRLKEMGFKVASPSLVALELVGHEKTAGVGRALGRLISAPVRALRLPFGVARAAVKTPGIALKYGLPAAAMIAPPVLLGGYLYGKAKSYGRDPELDSAYPEYR